VFETEPAAGCLRAPAAVYFRSADDDDGDALDSNSVRTVFFARGAAMCHATSHAQI
jgi:hypothetical protein